MENMSSESSSLPESIAAETDASSADEYLDELFQGEDSVVASPPVALAQGDAGIATIDGEDEYNDESFEEEDADNVPANGRLPASFNDAECQSGRDRSSDDTSDAEVNHYEDEEFENDECSDAEMPLMVGCAASAAFGDNDASSARIPDSCSDVEDTDQIGDDEDSGKAPPVDETKPELRRWCKLKMKALSVSSDSRPVTVADHRNSLFQPQMHSATPVSSSAISKLMDNARASRDRSNLQRQILGSYRYRQFDHAHASIVKHAAVPASLIDRAKTARFLATATKLSEVKTDKENMLSATNQLPTNSTQPGTSSLSAFVSVKTADLRGKLATASLDEMCMRWMQPSTRGGSGIGTIDDDFINIGTLELMEEMAKTQREIIRVASTDGGTRSEKYPQRTTTMSQTMETTKRQLKASVRTRQDAHAMLSQQI